MATIYKQCRNLSLYIVLNVVLLMGWQVPHCSGFNYPNETQKTLCNAQCEAMFGDNVTDCKSLQGLTSWRTNCTQSHCPGTCAPLFSNYEANINKLCEVPSINISQSGEKYLELTWQQSHLASQFTTIYIIEWTRQNPVNPDVSSESVERQNDTRYQVAILDVCFGYYRVMAINRFGSLGFSDPVKIPGLTPGPVQNITYTDNGVYFYKDELNPSPSKFTATLECQPPSGWQETDIKNYTWNSVQRLCKEISHDSVLSFSTVKNQRNRISIMIDGNSFGCVFTVEVQVVSKCLMYGEGANFTVNLTDCNTINGYNCSKVSSPPGHVENVTVSISYTPLMFSNASYTEQDTYNPLLVNLHIQWQPPSDLGSKGAVEYYIIKCGQAEKPLYPIPPKFIGVPNYHNISKNVVLELNITIPTQKIPYTFGVQVIAIGPDQVIQDNEWGLFPMKTINVTRNDIELLTINNGKVLLDEAGLVIIYVNNMMPMHFLFDTPIGSNGNSSCDRYALQWGPLVGPNRIQIENQTILPLNRHLLRVYLQHRVSTYGVKVLFLTADDEEPTEQRWMKTQTMPFMLPEHSESRSDHGTDTWRSAVSVSNVTPNLTTIFVAVGATLGVAIIIFVLRSLHQKHNFKHLERRLVEGVEVDTENGEHYFVLRISNNEASTDDIPTVVPDRWELPHCCLKIGKILGSGAFGQVAKGRVSRSLLLHRGIDTRTAQNTKHGTHITVAVKMLQECLDERYTRDFLNEIQMMKDIGYHTNIVSILGCCTLREPYCLVVEHVANGDLLTYLRQIRQHILQRESQMEGYVNEDLELLTPQDLLYVAKQICTGMEYLALKGFVHRDLAARNILVAENNQVKIGDFGLARYIYDDIGKIYVNRHGGKLPLRWMSPEAIFDLTFSTASDVWSFGILLYEIVTLGQIPYPDLSNKELLQKLPQGYRMDQPDNCSDPIYTVMLQCWNYSVNTRPSFTDLCNIFTSMLLEESRADYFDFKVTKYGTYYKIDSDMDSGQSNDLHHDVIANMLDQADCHDHKTVQMSAVVTDVSNADISLDKENSPKSPDMKYVAFCRGQPSRGSVHNELYPAIETEHDNNVAIAVNSVLKDSAIETEHNKNVAISTNCALQDSTIDIGYNDNNAISTNCALEDCIHYNEYQRDNIPFHKMSDMDNTSSSSDEVFFDCPGCTNRCNKHASMQRCTDCDRMTILLTPFDIYVDESNDSAISSTSTADLSISHSSASESSVISDDYLVPNSPLVTRATIDNYLEPHNHLVTRTDTDGYLIPDNMLDSKTNENIASCTKRDSEIDITMPNYDATNKISSDHTLGTQNNMMYFENISVGNGNFAMFFQRHFDRIWKKHAKRSCVGLENNGDIWTIAETKF